MPGTVHAIVGHGIDSAVHKDRAVRQGNIRMYAAVQFRAVQGLNVRRTRINGAARIGPRNTS